MKEGIGLKRLPALLITLLFTLVGCGAKEPTAVTIDRSFCCRVAIEQAGLPYEAELTVTPEQCAAVFSLPKTMNGMKMTAKNGCVSAQYGENKNEVSLPNPRQCFLYWLDRALMQSEATLSRKENTFTLQGIIENQKYLLTIDRESSLPLYFEMDSLDLTVKFQNGE